MFCTQCGTQNPEGINNCTNCGAVLDAENQAGSKKFDPAALIEQLRSNKYFVPGLAACAGLILIIVLVVLLGGGATKPIDTYMKAIAKNDVDKYISAFPRDYTKEYDEDDFEDELENIYDEFEDEYGKKFKITCKVLDKEKYDEDDLDDLAEWLEERYDLNENDVTAAYQVICKTTIKGSDEKDVEYVTFVVIKYDGKWCLHPQYA